MTTGPGTLYVVATPIGNLDDISPRARAVLGRVDLVVAEDTRRIRQLLTHFGISKPLMSLHEHNESGRVHQITERLGAGKSIALLSDAGTPLVSDPGYRLLAAARVQALPVSPIPGSCALIAALSVAGLPTDRFCFRGFLPARAGARQAALAALKECTATLIFYESVHRIGDTLADMADIFGPDRPATLARELTKLHETIYRGGIAELRAQLAADPGGCKGEFTLVVAGAEPRSRADHPDLERVVAILTKELPAAQAAGLAARITGAKRHQAYQIAVGIRRRS